jgi:hypothetical protein
MNGRCIEMETAPGWFYYPAASWKAHGLMILFSVMRFKKRVDAVLCAGLLGHTGTARGVAGRPGGFPGHP